MLIKELGLYVLAWCTQSVASPSEAWHKVLQGITTTQGFFCVLSKKILENNFCLPIYVLKMLSEAQMRIAWKSLKISYFQMYYG